MAKVGRKVKYTKDYLNEINEKLNKYIDEEDIPILAEFAYLNNIPRQKLYEFKELNDAIKKAITKKEANLEKGGLTGSINITMAIFSLKQLGWKDRHDIEHTGKDGGAIESKIVIEIIDPVDYEDQ